MKNKITFLEILSTVIIIVVFIIILISFLGGIKWKENY